MFSPSLQRSVSAWSFLVAFLAGSLCCEAITVTDLKGRSIEVDFVSLTGSSFTFRRQGNPKDFTISVDQFDVASQELIRKTAESAPAPAPKIQADVVIGKRRKDKADSYYMVKQEVTCTVKLTNLSKTAKVPAISGKIIFIGQNSKTPDLLTVLSSQSFESSLNTGETTAKEMDAFFTTYDSDNKGYGNLGGYQYYGYVLALLDPAGNIVLDQTTTGSFRLALTGKPALLKQVIDYAKGTALNTKLETAK